MNYLRRVVDWIGSLESGQQFRKWVSILAKILGALALVGAIVLGVALFVEEIDRVSNLAVVPQTLGIIGAILALGINIIVGIVIAMLFLNRSDQISELNDESRFTLLRIVVVLIRLFGEVSFLVLIGTGAQGLIAGIFGTEVPEVIIPIFGWRIPDIAEAFLPPWETQNIRFIIGVIFSATSVLYGAILLIIHYFTAELINLFLDMATDLRKIETTLADEGHSQEETNE